MTERKQAERRIVDRLLAAVEPALVTEVVPSEPVDGAPVTVEQSGLPGDPLPPEVNSVLVGRFSVLTRAFWAMSRAGWVGACESDAIEVALREKEPLIPAYRQRVQELWLALAIAETAPSSFVDVEVVAARSYTVVRG